MRNRSKSMMILFFAFVLFATHAETYTLEPDGSDGQIQAAIDNASDGDTIILSNGIYRVTETISISNRAGITLKSDTIATIECLDYVPILDIADSKGVTLENLVIYHSGGTQEAVGCGPEASVLGISDSSGITVRRCELNGCGSVGILVFDSSNLKILDNYIHDNNSAAIIVNAEKQGPKPAIAISGNAISDNAAPVIFRILDDWTEVSSVTISSDKQKVVGISLSNNRWENNAKSFPDNMAELTIIGRWLSEKTVEGEKAFYVFKKDGTWTRGANEAAPPNASGTWKYRGIQEDDYETVFEFELSGGDPREFTARFMSENRMIMSFMHYDRKFSREVKITKIFARYRE